MNFKRSVDNFFMTWWFLMKISSTLLWRGAIFILWLFFASATILDGFRSGGFMRPVPGEAHQYPIAGVTIVILAMFLQSVFLGFLSRPHDLAKARLQNGFVVVAFLVISIGAIFLFFVTDLPNYFYFPAQLTVLLVLLLFLRILISAILLSIKFFSKKVRQA
jgi:hypothetical protein